MPAIDLVLATAGRTAEPAQLLESLEAQTFRDFRLIIVDQNADDRLSRLLSGLALEVLRIAQPQLGSSLARNVGLRHVEASLVGFPDDDCWYRASLLGEVADFFAAHPQYQGLSGRSADEEGRPSGGRWDRRAGPITRFNVWKRAGTYTVFLRRSVVEVTGSFDETLGLGPGAEWGVAEDRDYVLRAVEAGCALYYEPQLCVYHGQRREGSGAPASEAGYRYGLGMGRVLKKNRLPAWFAAYQLTRSFGASALSLLSGRPAGARFYWAVGKGRLRGWRSDSTAS